MTEIVLTANSVYEVDFPGDRIRRLSGVRDPTPRQGADGLWQAAHVTDWHDGALLIDWLDKPGSTLTSPRVVVESCALQLFRGSRYGPTPEPPEYCDLDAAPDSDYCDAHRFAEGD